ncbi:MAG: LysR substrate-binding domain-containing protein [Paracoccus sp. (in: a-proteobacteria)]|nr:LysR substrate-binding domain-containing protein [Paracoccus sp. (in: a-proteobacteria)]
MPIELRHLRYAVAASQCGSFRRAAVSLGVEQSAISRRIRELEDELGVSLFNRHSGGVVPTHAGKKFVRHAQQALIEVTCAAADVGPIGCGEEGVVRLGIFSSLASGFLAQMLRTYSERYRGVHIDIVEGAPTDHIAAVRLKKLDVAFVTGSPSLTDCDAAQFWTERVFVVLPDGHALAKQEAIRWNDLCAETFIISEGEPGPEIHDFLIKHLADLGVHPSIERHRVGRDNLMQIVSFRRGVTLTSESTVATPFPGVVYRRLEGEVLPFCAVWSPNNDNPAWRRMLSLARLAARRNRICESK